MEPLAFPSIRRQVQSCSCDLGLYVDDSTNFNLTQRYIVVTILGVSIYNCVELIPFIFATFKRYRGLYFWSLMVSILGILMANVSNLISNFYPNPPRLQIGFIGLFGWALMVTGQSLVLYSRLDLLPLGDKTRRWVYTNASLGRVKNLYLDWARVSGPMSAECQQLSRLFSQCVDGNRIRIPPKLENAPQPGDTPPFILDELHDAAKLLMHNYSSESKIWDGYDFSALELLLAGDNIAMSEFDAIRLALGRCNRHHTPIDDFLHLFDFNAVSAEEKAWILAQLPPSSHTPSLVLNALCSSHLLQEDKLCQFNIQHPGIRWQRLYSSSWERQAMFLDRAARALQLFHRKLIVFRVDDRLTLAIYVPRKVEPSQECVVDDCVRVFAFPHSQGPETQSRLVLPTKKNYRLYCDENSLQLFENRRANTWIFITRGPSDDSLYRSTEDRGDRRRQRQSTIDSGLNIDNRASIALNKFSKGLQRHVGRVNRNGISASVR